MLTVFAPYVVPGSDKGKYDVFWAVFLWSLFGALACWMDARGGGPGRISVAKDGSPSRCGGCTTGTAAIRQAGTTAAEVIMVRVEGEVVMSVDRPKDRGNFNSV